MFKVLRCPKCDHVITGQDEFVKNIMERFNDNLRKLEHVTGRKYQKLLHENSMLKSYLKQVLHYRSEIERIRIENIHFNKVLIWYLLNNNLITTEKLNELQETARDKMNKSLEARSKELEKVYGDFNSIFGNKIKSDPTLDAVIRGEK
jgi:tetrahydromethanopterin S-methyltransferase subunit G